MATLILVDTYAGWKGSLPEEKERPVEAVGRVLAASPEEFDPTPPGLFASATPTEFVPLMAEMAAVARGRLVRLETGLMAETDQRDLLPRSRHRLLIWGELDVRSPLSVAGEFERLIPDTKLVVIPEAGHVSNLEQPEQFNEAVREFCRAHRPPPSSSPSSIRGFAAWTGWNMRNLRKTTFRPGARTSGTALGVSVLHSTAAAARADRRGSGSWSGAALGRFGVRVGEPRLEGEPDALGQHWAWYAATRFGDPDGVAAHPAVAPR